MAKSTEIGRTGPDRVTRSLSGLSSGGFLVTAWWKILDPGASPFSTSNFELGAIEAPDWLVRCIVGSCSTNASGIGSMSCNLMLFTSSTADYNYDAYIGDFAFYAGGAGGLTAAQLKGWNWVAWWIEPGSTFTMRQWLRLAGQGGVFLATDGGTDTSSDARHAGASDPPTDFLFPTNFDVPNSNGYAWHPKIHAFASAPTIAQLDAIALQTAPDATAFGDWLFEAPGGTLDHSDQSGNGRTLSDVSPGTTTFYEGPDAPLLSVVYQGQSAISYSATSPTPTYPTLLANDGLLLFVAQKPQTANGGTVTTPSGYTLLGSKLASGGYGATLGADTGNLNYLVYKKDTVTGSESGTLSITTSDNNVAFAWFAQFRSQNGTYDFEVGTAEDSTSGSTLSLAFTSVNIQAGDVLVAAFAQPTDITTPSQFSAQAISGTGLTTAFIAELAEADSGTNNDIGGVHYVADVTAGAGATSVTLTATCAGATTTNYKGPGLLVRVRQVAAAAASAPIDSPPRVAYRRPALRPLPYDALPPMSAAAAAPPPPEAPRVVRFRASAWATPPTVLPPQIGVFTGSGFPESVPPRIATRRIAPVIPDALPPVAIAAAPPPPPEVLGSTLARRVRLVPPPDALPPAAAAAPPAPPASEALGALPARRVVRAPLPDLPPPQAGVFTGTGFPQLVPPVIARRVPPPVPFDAPPPIPTPPAPPASPAPVALPATLPRRTFTQDQPLPPLQMPAPPAPFVVRAFRAIFHPLAPMPMPAQIFPPPPPPPEAPRAIRVLKRIWRYIHDVGWPQTAGPINTQIVRPPLMAVVGALDQTATAPGVAQVAVFDSRDMTVTPDT